VKVVRKDSAKMDSVKISKVPKED